MSFYKKKKFQPGVDFFQLILNYIEIDISIKNLIVQSGQRAVFYCEKDSNAYVLKISEYFPTAIARIKREIKILTEIDSHYFPKVLKDYFVTEEELNYFAEHIEESHPEIFKAISNQEVTPFFITVEAYIPHRPWDEELVKELSDTRKLLDLAENIFKALSILWDKNIIHRDIKPPNILVKVDYSPVVIDLGIAKSLNPDTEQLTPVLFSSPHTPHFASPEQLNNQNEIVSYKSDQFSVGVILYYILTGEFPFGDFDKEEKLTIVKNMLTNNIKSIKNLELQRTQELEDFIFKLLKYHPHERFRVANDIFSTIQMIREKL